MKEFIDQFLMWTALLLVLAFFGIILYMIWTSDGYDPTEVLMIRLLFTDAIAIVFVVLACKINNEFW
jgi:hypothetical protein